MMKGLSHIAILSIALLFAACEKEEKPYTLPEPGPAKMETVNMGSDYSKVIFYNLNNNKITVKNLGDWDLALKASPDGRHALINGGYGIQVAAMGDTSFTALYDVSKADWQWDHPSLTLDSTAIGDWADDQLVCTGQVYILDRGKDAQQEQYKKLQLVKVDDKHYLLRTANLDGSQDQYIKVEKDDDYTFIYVNLDKGQLSDFEPKKDDWDFMFIRYRYVYYDMTPVVPYEVNGVILNSNNVEVADTNGVDFHSMDLSTALNLTYTKRRDFIGFDWKYYDFDKEAYITDIKRVFVIKSHSSIYYKLRFIDFYDAQGVKGAPSFEVQGL